MPKFLFALLASAVAIGWSGSAGAADAHASAHAASISYPATKTVEQKDNYFGTDVADPYRWLEDDNSAETKAWVDQENVVTRAYLDRIPYRQAALERLKNLLSYERVSAPTVRGGDLYYSKNDGLQNQSVLMIDKGAQGHPEVLLDPNTFSSDGTIRLTSFTISKDGHYLVWGQTAIPGSDWEEFHVMDMSTRKPLPDVLHWIKFSGVAFVGNGFYYSRLPTPAPGTELTVTAANQKIYFHKIGDAESADKLIYQDPDHPSFYNIMATSEDERFAFLIVGDPNKRGTRLSVLDETNPNKTFVPVIADITDDSYDVVTNIGSTVIIKTNHDAPNWKLQKFEVGGNASTLSDFIKEKPEPIDHVSSAGDHIFITYLKDVASQTEIYDMSGKFENRVELPGLGDVDGFDGQKSDATAYYSYTSMNYPPTVFRYDMATHASTVFATPKIPGFNPADYVSKQVFFKSKDGTRVPMFIVYKKGLKLTGQNPTILYGYGGFDITLNPSFSASNIAWLEQGGVYAMANLRGGGEYGEKWHEAGMKLSKQNVFDDCIAAAQYLIAEKYTSPKRLALEGGSNGGLLVGAVINQRPDLFQVGLPEVGVMDMLRFQKFSAGTFWVADYGSSDDEEDFKNLIKYSPLQNIKSGVSYPALLVGTSDHDDRVVPAHSFKYIATMQAKDTGPRPHLIRIETNSGHGASSLSKRIAQSADLLAFTWTNMGVTPRYPVAAAPTAKAKK